MKLTNSVDKRIVPKYRKQQLVTIISPCQIILEKKTDKLANSLDALKYFLPCYSFKGFNATHIKKKKKSHLFSVQIVRA